MEERTWTGERLKALMERTGLNNLQMADRLKVTPEAIRNWLADKYQPRQVHRLALDRIEQRFAGKVKA